MNNVYNEPKYDTDTANKGYVDKTVDNAINGVEDDINEVDGKVATKSKNFGSQPTPPYRVNDTWMNGTDIYICNNERLIGNFVASDWQKASNYDNTKSILDGGITTDGTLVVAKGGTVAAGLTAYDSGDNKVRIWAGATLANRATAPFRVLQNGSVFMTKANITGGNIQLHSNNVNDIVFKTYLDGYESSVYSYLNPNLLSLNNGNLHCSLGFALGMPGMEVSRTSGNDTYFAQAFSDFIWVSKLNGSTQVTSQIKPEEITTPKLTAGNIDCGTCTLNTVNDTVVSFNKTFSSPPIVILTCKANNTGTNVYSGSVIATTTTNFTAFSMVNVSTNKNIPFNWMAIGT